VSVNVFCICFIFVAHLNFEVIGQEQLEDVDGIKGEDTCLLLQADLKRNLRFQWAEATVSESLVQRMWAQTRISTVSQQSSSAHVQHLVHRVKPIEEDVLQKMEDTLRELNKVNFTLPLPDSHVVAAFAAKHGCQADHEEPLQKFFSSPTWKYSDQREELRSLIAAASANYTKPVMISLFEPRGARPAFLWMIRDFACHARRVGMQPVLMVLDSEVKEIINAHPPLRAVSLSLLLTEVKRLFDLEQVGVDLMKWPSALAALEESAPAVFVSDIDILWLHDPRNHLLSMGNHIDVAVAMDSQIDYLRQPDASNDAAYWVENVELEVKKEPDPMIPACCKGGFPYNAGIVFLRGVPQVRSLVQRMISTHRGYVARTTDRAWCHEDQNPMQWALFEHCSTKPSSCRLLDPGLFMDASLTEHLEDLSPIGVNWRNTVAVHEDTDDKQQHMTTDMVDFHDACLANVDREHAPAENVSF